MCFSATGSLTAAGVLATIGVLALRSTASKPHRLYAATPLLFAAQQACEGVVWLTIGNADSSPVHRFAVDAFLAFALVVWPLWLPVALQQVERDPMCRRWLIRLVIVGVGVSACAAFLLIEWQPLARVAGHSICYDYSPTPDVSRPALYLAIYSLPTVVPFFVSSARLARVTGVALILSLIATVLIQRDALASVWCFFAAALSGLILTAIILEERRGHEAVTFGSMTRYSPRS